MTLKNLALEIATKAHAGQVDKAGRPYLDHLLTVASGFAENDMRHITALLHDIVEDTSTTLQDLRVYGFPDEVVDAVNAITKRHGEPYDEYISRVKSNALARDVKVLDMRHNSLLSRLPRVTPADYARVEKYGRAIAVLSKP